MNKEEIEIALTLVSAFSALPDAKKEYLLGYAEGVAAMAANHTIGADSGKERGENYAGT